MQIQDTLRSAISPFTRELYPNIQIVFSAMTEWIMWFSYFSLFMWWIMFIDLHMLITRYSWLELFL